MRIKEGHCRQIDLCSKERTQDYTVARKTGRGKEGNRARLQNEERKETQDGPSCKVPPPSPLSVVHKKKNHEIGQFWRRKVCLPGTL